MKTLRITDISTLTEIPLKIMKGKVQTHESKNSSGTQPAGASQKSSAGSKKYGKEAGRAQQQRV